VVGMAEPAGLQLARTALGAPQVAGLAEPKLFTRHSAAELALPVGPLEFLVTGLLARPTYGQIAGELKTLKSHVATSLALGVASGTRVLGYFDVPEPAPVLSYVGEGGAKPYRRRIQAMAAAMGLDLGTLPLEVSFDVAPIQSAEFRGSLERDLRDLRPGLVLIDPYYAYHGSQSSAANLYEEGELLSGLSSTCLGAEASLMMVNHFNQTGRGGGLKRITMAGSGEWVDSWILLSHRTQPRVPTGEFFLKLEIGSRQWGGAEFALDLEVGSFDPVTGSHDGPMRWSVQPMTTAAADEGWQTVLDILADQPWRQTKTGLAAKFGGNQQGARRLIEAMEAAGVIRAENRPVLEGTRMVTRPVYAGSDEPVPAPET